MKPPPPIYGRTIKADSPEGKALLAQFDPETMELKEIAEWRRRRRARTPSNSALSPPAENPSSLNTGDTPLQPN